ncbi:hypothetical protein R1flu_023899 [Riccia fluitans]|uniref:[2Fe-2S]-binding domain-containing protein n=1 Tax=Riccia fluitans TaxID=41844 RepID=A0ABD1XTH9_9MARC
MTQRKRKEREDSRDALEQCSLFTSMVAMKAVVDPAWCFCPNMTPSQKGLRNSPSTLALPQSAQSMDVQITTTEGLKQGKEPHAVQTRLAGFHATQCGFCTPGIAVSIAASLRKCSRKAKDEGRTPLPTSVEAETFIAGNICRCTGYRPILDVCKSFASNVDIEDLGINTF